MDQIADRFPFTEMLKVLDFPTTSKHNFKYFVEHITSYSYPYSFLETNRVYDIKKKIDNLPLHFMIAKGMHYNQWEFLLIVFF